MLVLTRKSQETIQIGQNITITIVRVKGRSVRVGIDAPRSVRVVRGELTADAAETDEAAADDEQAVQDTPTEQPGLAPAAAMPSAGLHNRVSRLVGQLREGQASASARENPKPAASGVNRSRLVRQPSRLGPGALRTLIRR